jgi:hypothetical protein
MPQRPTCSRCGKAPTKQWVQLISLVVLLVAIVGNSLAGWFLLPRVAAEHPGRVFFRAWLWADVEGARYGWMPLAGALLAWEFFVWRKIRKSKPMPKIKGWVSRKILTFVLAAGFAPILPWWIPAGQPSDKTLATLGQYPGVPCALSWSAVLIVTTILCVRPETRDKLMGNGKTLSLISLGALAIVLTLTLVGWSLS